MKKFLSLVLALIMTMSLVTISASATEYKDFTDKDEIQYEEAVAVLNKLGIITGYSEGDFRPEGELTRGAAAKIIVSLLIGPEAAENVSPTSAPYKDVPLDHTFAGAIAYCKTANIISGYSDGSFQPGGTLTGYAFSKMLLGALGYKSDAEHFTGSGWNMRVNAIGAEAHLFDRISFKGNEPVNREQAAQLALNTLKATMVDYTGGMTVTAGDASLVSPAQRVYKTSNQDFARNISADTAANNSEYYTVEFGEEHFIDLKLEHDKHNPTEDDFGRPSNEWSYKKVTIGTFPIPADFTYTEQVAHLVDKDAAKERALGLAKYEVTADSRTAAGWTNTHVYVNGFLANNLDKIATIADYTDNGATVEVYVDNDDADFISHVVVTQPLLVEVKKVGSDYVSLDLIEADQKGNGFNQNPLDNYDRGNNNNVAYRGMNEIDRLANVEVDDDAYDVLSALKANDKVVVIPVSETHAGGEWKVARAYVPETATGSLTRVSTYDQDADGITVGGTAYKVSQWNKDIKDIDADIIKVTVKDVTLYLDENGNAMLAEDVGETSDYMIVGSWSQSLVNGKIVHVADGWDISGEPLSLNVGLNRTAGVNPGDLVKYTNENAPNHADWVLLDGDNETADFLNGKSNTRNTAGYYEDLTKIYEVNDYADTNATTGAAAYVIKSSNGRIALKAPAYEIPPTTANPAGTLKVGARANVVITAAGAEKDVVYGAANLLPNSTFNFANDVKFIYVDYESNGNDVDRIEILKGPQNVTTRELQACSPKNSTVNVGRAAQAVVDKNGEVKAVVIKTQSTTATSNNLMYIRDHWGEHIVEEATNGERVYGYTVVMVNTDGTVDEEKNIYCDKSLNIGTFATYTASTMEGFDDYYLAKAYDSQLKNISVMKANGLNPMGGASNVINKWLLNLGAPTTMGNVALRDATGNETLDGASWIASNQRGTSDTIEDGQRAVNVVHVTSSTKWVDLTGHNIDSLDDMKEYFNIDIRIIVNDNRESDSFRNVALMIIDSATGVQDRADVPTGLTINANPVAPATGYEVGTVVTLTANITNSSRMKSLSYVWFVDTNGNNAYDTDETRIGGNEASVVVTAGQYDRVKVIVTNTDSDKTISTSSANSDIEVKVDTNTLRHSVRLVLTGVTAMVDGSEQTNEVNLSVTKNQVIRVTGLTVLAPETKELPAAATVTPAGKADVTAIANGQVLITNVTDDVTITIAAQDKVMATEETPATAETPATETPAADPAEKN